ncbi:MAG: PSD1 domain-containing protein [Planctomycetia bacterium]|nr:PSD1 domain-containing protein [Planctomycetia bacterium]
MARFPTAVALAFAAASICALHASDNEPSPEQVQFFESKVRPLLAGRCFKCHGPEKQKGGLRLDSRERALAGGESGPAVVPGKPDESLLVDAINFRGLEMPKDGRLKPGEVEILTEWVRLGAPWPNSTPPGPPFGRGGREAKPSPKGPRRGAFEITDDDLAHWSFQPLRRPAIPEVGDAAWPANTIDNFILAKLDERGLSPSPPAERRELCRRAWFDLVGLPPPPEEVEVFAADDSPGAYERLLDRLLAMPQYGERWGRHWLDLVRFAQTNGYERDDEKPLAWRYRDYVIRSLNDDKPYDQFIVEQLAGDELDGPTDDSIDATGFFRIGVWDDEPDEKPAAQYDELDDVLRTSGEAFLGLTVGCARCHDHKFEPISQENYYQLLSYFRGIAPYGKDKSATHWEQNADAIFAPLPSGAGKTLAVRNRPGETPATRILVRGNHAAPSKEVQPAFLEVLGSLADEPPRTDPTFSPHTRRRELAEWIASPHNPLTARVIVNRLWQHHFGRAIVATPSDFGRAGSPPSHQELLDWLACELIEGGWRLKRTHKLMMLSSAYRQSSRVKSEKAVAADPDNTLLWRQNIRRLQAEAIRDAVLSVSGRLNLELGGRGFFPDQPPEVLATQSKPGHGWDQSSEAEQSRRSVYIFAKRTLGVPFLETFDGPNADKPAPSRATTTIAPQALVLLNNPFIEKHAGEMAERLRRETASGNDRAAHVARAFRLALGRPPTPEEARLSLAYLERQYEAADERDRADGRKTPPTGDEAYRQALASFCLLVFNLNEFVYVD